MHLLSFFASRDAANEILQSARAVLRESDNTEKAISLLQDALSLSPNNSEIHAELSCAYCATLLLFATQYIQKNRDSYAGPPLKKKTYVQLSSTEQKCVTDTLRLLADSIQATKSTARSPLQNAEALWIQSWIVRLLKDYYISQLLPPQLPLMVQEDELSLIDKAIELAPKKWELLASKGDFSLQARPDSLSGFKLDQGNYDALRCYQQASKLSGIRSDYFFAILSTIHRKNKRLEPLEALTDAALSRDRNAYYIYCKAELALSNPQKFRELIKQAEACERFYQPTYSPSIYPSLKRVWSRVKEEFTVYQQPIFYQPISNKLLDDISTNDTWQNLCVLNRRLILSVTSDKRIQKQDLQSAYFLVGLNRSFQGLHRDLVTAERQGEAREVLQMQKQARNDITTFFRRIGLPEDHDAFQRIASS